MISYSTLLGLHILGACATAFFSAYAGYILWMRLTSRYALCARVLGILATYQVGTGAMLAILSPLISARSLCGNIVLYLGAIALLEAVLYMRMRQGYGLFPARMSLSPVAGALAVFAGAMVLGL